jgi:hypothetical protein
MEGEKISLQRYERTACIAGKAHDGKSQQI